MTQTQQLGSLPIFIALESGKVAFQRTMGFLPIIDQPETGVQAILSVSDIFIGSNTEVLYNEWYDYESMPELMAYLVALKLISSTAE